MAFKLKYNCIPGDCATATNFFGTQLAGGGCPWTTTPNNASNQATCNGNGDGLIWNWPALFDYTYAYEKLRFWQHLSAAGLVSQSFTGIGDTGDGRLIEWSAGALDINMPQTKMNSVGISIINGSRMSWDGTYFPNTLTPTNKFVVGEAKLCFVTTPCVYQQTAPIQFAGAAFTPLEAQSIDSKYDNGKPATGKVTAPHLTDFYFGLYCSTSDTVATAEYFLGNYDATITSTTKRCPLFFEAGF